MVLILWAITTMVALWNWAFISACIFYSVIISILAVASSKITMADLRRMALQMQINWRSPDDKLAPFSLIS